MAEKQARKTPNIRERNDGTWEARTTVRLQPNGKSERISFYAKTKKAAEMKMKRFLIDLEDGKLSASPRDMTLGQWLDEWMAEYKKQQLKSTTYFSYNTQIENHIKPSLGDHSLTGLRQLDIQKFANSLTYKGLKPASVYGVMKVLKCAMKKALVNDLIPKDITFGVTLPKIEKPPVKALSEEQRDSFIKIAKDSAHGRVFTLGLFTGMRIGELLGLRWQDISFDNKFLKVENALNYVKDVDDPESKWRRELGTPKTQSSKRDIPLPLEAVKLLHMIRQEQREIKLKLGAGYEDNDFVFATGLGKPLDRNNMQQSFKKICKKLDLDGFSIHSTRHTFATISHAQGMDIKVLQEILGHANISETADTYTHVDISTKRKAMEKLTMPAI